MTYEEARALDTKSQTAFGVAIICLVFVAETLQITRGHPKPASVVVLAFLGVVGVASLGVGIHFYRRARREPVD